tara:strand:- start:29002 stop:29541 length:540 start_codon:yes stop_codon:yes gene_type:complete
MKKLEHAMIDIETMSTTPNAAIVSVGIVIFDPRYGKISKKTYYSELDWQEQNRDKDKDTRKWWSKLDKGIQEALEGIDSLGDTLNEIADFLPADCKVWGNGPTFDITILENAYRQFGIDIPWKFWNIRDCRTVLDMYESKRGGLNKKVGGNAHNALYDAQYQAEYIIKMWKELLGDKPC